MRSKYSAAEDLRKKARHALRDRWVIASIAFLLFALFAMGGTGGSVSVDLETEEVMESVEEIEYTLPTYLDNGDVLGAIEYLVMDTVVGLVLVVGAFASLVLLIYSIFVAAPLKTGYYRYNLDLYARRKDAGLDTMLFGFRERYWKSVGTFFLRGLIIAWKTFLGSLVTGLFLGLGAGLGPNLLGAFLSMIGYIAMFWMIIRLIVLSFDYAMAGYLVAERADLSPREILRESKRIMHGNRLRLFGLHLSFIGWYIVGLFTLGIGLIPVGAYVYATETAFYRELGKKSIGLF